MRTCIPVHACKGSHHPTAPSLSLTHTQTLSYTHPPSLPPHAPPVGGSLKDAAQQRLSDASARMEPSGPEHAAGEAERMASEAAEQVGEDEGSLGGR